MMISEIIRVILHQILKHAPSPMQSWVKTLLRFQKTPCNLLPLLKQFNAVKGQLPYTTSNKTVLFWRGVGGIQSSLAIELVIASALIWRGLNVTFVLCDGLLSGCLQRSVENSQTFDNWSTQCQGCCHTGTSLIKAVGLQYRYAGEWVTSLRRKELRLLADTVNFNDIESWRHHNVPVGQYALSSSVRHFKGQAVTRDVAFTKILREYFYSSLVNTESAKIAIDELKPEQVFMQHGIYVDWGPPFDIALNSNIPVTLWMRGYLKNHLYMKTATHDDPRHMYYPVENEWQACLNNPLSVQGKERLSKYMQERLEGSNNRFQLFSKPPLDAKDLRQQLDLQEEKPVWAVFTHLNWESIFAFEPILFRDPTEWILETFKVISKVRDVTWIIKIHPAERIFGTAYGSQQIINDHFPSLPSHIRVIPADSDINTYGLFPLLNGGVTINGTVGMELPMLGTPIILSGKSHYAGKGFTHESYTKDQYFSLLRHAFTLQRLSIEQIQTARRYAYNFFIERQIPFELVSKNGRCLEFKTFDNLRPNQNSALDMICERMLEGGEFILSSC